MIYYGGVFIGGGCYNNVDLTVLVAVAVGPRHRHRHRHLHRRRYNIHNIIDQSTIDQILNKYSNKGTIGRNRGVHFLF